MKSITQDDIDNLFIDDEETVVLCKKCHAIMIYDVKTKKYVCPRCFYVENSETSEFVNSPRNESISDSKSEPLCPRCEGGYGMWPGNKTCHKCGYPGLKHK